jgi:hypothetical protein
VASGGWWSAQRLTFFYAFEATPPFRVRCATSPISFGLSRTVPPLEYATHVERHDDDLFVSVGVDNCARRSENSGRLVWCAAAAWKL